MRNGHYTTYNGLAFPGKRGWIYIVPSTRTRSTYVFWENGTGEGDLSQDAGEPDGFAGILGCHATVMSNGQTFLFETLRNMCRVFLVSKMDRGAIPGIP